jgi:hypothetical protein
VTWTATDGGNNSLSCPQSVVVNDVEPPVIAGLAADPNLLWPANHQMRVVAVNYTVTDNCTAPPAIDCDLQISSNEPPDGRGDGHTSPDWEVLNDHHVKLRAERDGRGTSRIYTETVACTDEFGNATSAATTVRVPHDLRK